METATKRLYEAMFLVDSAQAAGDWDGTVGAIETVLKRADADVVTLNKWSEQRLAYDVGKSSRGTYMLCYFKANSQSIMGLEKDVRLSEKILRMLVLSAEDRPEGFNDKDIAAAMEKAKALAQTAPAFVASAEDTTDAKASGNETKTAEVEAVVEPEVAAVEVTEEKATE